MLASTLARAGVGSLRIVDRDCIELNNLQRQVLFDEDDIAAHLPKAEAARRKLQRVNSGITIEAAVTDVQPVPALREPWKRSKNSSQKKSFQYSEMFRKTRIKNILVNIITKRNM